MFSIIRVITVFFKIFFLVVSGSALLVGCDSTNSVSSNIESNDDSKLSFSIPKKIQERVLPLSLTGTLRAYLVVDNGIRYVLTINQISQQASGSVGGIGVGNHTFQIVFEYTDNRGVLTELATVSQSIRVSEGSNSVAFLGSNYRYTDNDADGYSNLDELAFSSDPNNFLSVPPASVMFAKEISSGFKHTCSINNLGVVSCWGDNSSGQTTVPLLSNPTSVSAGGSHTCAIDAGSVVCWGDNTRSQTTVPFFSNAIFISSGGFHTCAIDDGGVSCWGSNALGQTAAPSLSNPVFISSGSAHTCAIDDSGVVCWGNNTDGQTTVPTLSNPTAVSAGDAHTCAIDDFGVLCWGSNANNQITMPFFSRPISISSGVFHSCVMDDSGVVCWGNNVDGQTRVPVLSNPTSVSSGGFHTCAIDDSGIVCWGSDSDGQITVPSTTFISTPIQNQAAPIVVNNY